MTTLIIRNLAGQYRISPDKREQILRYIYRDSGKTGLQSFVRALGGTSVELFLKWVKNDYKNKIRSRRGQKTKLLKPPIPPGDNNYGIRELLNEIRSLSQDNGGRRSGRGGGKSSIYNAQAWDAKNGGGR